MVIELLVWLLNQTPLPAEQILWVKFPVCFSELTEESATTLNKSKKTKKENMQIPQKHTIIKNPHIIHTTGY